MKHLQTYEKHKDDSLYLQAIKLRDSDDIYQFIIDNNLDPLHSFNNKWINSVPDETLIENLELPTLARYDVQKSLIDINTKVYLYYYNKKYLKMILKPEIIEEFDHIRDSFDIGLLESTLCRYGAEKLQELLTPDFIESIFRKYDLTCISKNEFTYENFIIYEVDKFKQYDYLVRCQFSIYSEYKYNNIYKLYNKEDILEKITHELGAEKYFISGHIGSYQICVYFYINYDDCKTKLESMDLGLL